MYIHIMTLEKLLLKVNDSCIVKVFSASNGKELAIYNGRDSIPKEYNDCEVTDIFTKENVLCIEVNC